MRASWGLACGFLLACSTAPSSSELRPAPTANVDLATPNREPVALSLDDKGVRFGDQLLVRLSEDRAKGAEESHKRRGPDDLLLVPVEAWIKDRRNEGRLDATLTLILQRETPYRGLMEVLFTAGQNEISAFDLYESSAAGRSLHLDLPRGPTVSPSTLNLTLLVAHDGVSIKTSSGNLAPGCREIGRGIAVPRLDGKLDLLAVEACARFVKGAEPAFAKEDTVTLSANPGLPVSELFDLALALRGTPEAPLLPKVQLGVSR